MQITTPVVPSPVFQSELLGLQSRHLTELAKSGDKEAISHVASEFEGLFASTLLKEMQQTLETGSIFGEEADQVFGGLFELLMGQYIGQTKSLGIADMVQRYLESQAG